MPDPCTLRFYDYYEAQLAVHQLEEEGHRATAYEFVYSLAPWPGAEFRVVVFEDGQTGEPMEDGSDPQFGEFESGQFVQSIDDLLRYLTVACAFIGLIIAIRSVLKFAENLPAFTWADLGIGAMILAFAIFLLFCGARFAVSAHDGYRRNDPFWVVLMRIVGCGMITCSNIVIALAALVVLGLYGVADESESD